METTLSILVLALFVMPFAALALWRKGARKQAVLMLVLTAVVAANLAIWTLPDAAGNSPVTNGLK